MQGLSVSNIRINEDPNKIDCDAVWTLPSGITDTNCDGYWLALLPEGQLEIANAETIRVNGGSTVSATLTFDITRMGSYMDLYIYALGKENQASASLPSERAVITLPGERVSSSGELTVELQNQYGQPIVGVPAEQDLRHARCVLKWKNPQDPKEQEKLAGHRLILKDGAGKVIPLMGTEGDARFVDISNLTEEYTVDNIDLFLYQGQTLTWSVINTAKPYVTPPMFSSEPAIVNLPVPQLAPAQE